MVRSLGAVLLAIAIVGAHPVPADAAREHFHERQVPWGGLLEICTSEPVLVTGTTHVNMMIRIDERKGGMRVWVHTISRGTGIGSVTLANYAALGIDHFFSKLDPDGSEQIHLVLDILLIGRSVTKAPPSHFYVRLKMTFPAGGGAPEIQHEDTGCR